MAEPTRPITFYVHHDGRGHLARTAQVIGALAVPATVVTSAPIEAGDLPPGTTTTRLPSDVPAGPRGDVHAGGTLHWAPQDLPLATARAAAILDHLRAVQPGLVVVDVSVEAAVLCRLAGARVVVVRLAGRRDDAPHRLALRMADGLLAPFPEAFEDPWTPPWVRARTFYAGCIGPEPRPAPPPRPPARPRRVLLVWGRGTPPPSPARLAATVAATPGWSWSMVGPPVEPVPGLDTLGWVGDVGAHMADADVVVGTAGDGVVAAALAARRPLIVLPQERPFGEQAARAARLGALGLAVVAPRWPTTTSWPQVLHRSLGLRGDPGVAGLEGAAARTARWLEALAAGRTGRAVEPALAVPR